MKKNFNRLIVQIDGCLTKTPMGKFKVACTNLNQYTNKILVDSK